MDRKFQDSGHSPERLILPVILFAGTLTVMAGTIIAPVLNVMRDQLGVGPSRAGLIITTHSVFIALLSPFIGHLIDRVGVRRPLVAGLVLYSAAGGAGLVIDSWWPLIVSRALLGAGAAVIFIANTVMILNLYSGRRRNRVMGWRSSANALGAAIWPAIGGALGAYSWHWPFAAYLAGIPLALLVLFIIPETHRTQPDGPENNNVSLVQIFRAAPVLLGIYGLIFLSSVLLYALVVYGPPLMEQASITNPFQIGLFVSSMGLASALVAVMYGRIKASFSYRALIMFALALWTVAFLPISQWLSAGIIAAAFTVYGASQGVISPVCMVWIGEVTPRSYLGRVSSYLGSFAFVGQFASPVIFAPVALRAGPQGVFFVSGMIGVLLLVILAIFWRK
ncbi:MAG: MFS transporter [Candidatus Glassbacteria bacterium]|nr:MFS transporter [Candidatus Glassbacteria bacterium]